MTSTQSGSYPNTLDKRLAHLKPSERAALAELVDRLRQRYSDNLLRVVLFGSKARGDFDEESDLDVLVVVTQIPDEAYWQRRREIIAETYDYDKATRRSICSFFEHRGAAPARTGRYTLDGGADPIGLHRGRPGAGWSGRHRQLQQQW